MRKFAPLTADHNLVGAVCPACKQAFQVGDELALIELGPGADPDEQEKARQGRSYNAVAQPVHWSCATGEE